MWPSRSPTLRLLPSFAVPAFPRRLKLLLDFSVVQLGIQFLAASSGFLLVQVLDKTEFAAYTLAASLFTLLNVLTDSGIGTGLNAVGGRIWHDRDALSRLISTALSLRRTLAWYAIPIGIIFSLSLL